MPSSGVRLAQIGLTGIASMLRLRRALRICREAEFSELECRLTSQQVGPNKCSGIKMPTACAARPFACMAGCIAGTHAGPLLFGSLALQMPCRPAYHWAGVSKKQKEGGGGAMWLPQVAMYDGAVQLWQDLRAALAAAHAATGGSK
jgi:hypothetical protein